MGRPHFSDFFHVPETGEARRAERGPHAAVARRQEAALRDQRQSRPLARSWIWRRAPSAAGFAALPYVCRGAVKRPPNPMLSGWTRSLGDAEMAAGRFPAASAGGEGESGGSSGSSPPGGGRQPAITLRCRGIGARAVTVRSERLQGVFIHQRAHRGGVGDRCSAQRRCGGRTSPGPRRAIEHGVDHPLVARQHRRISARNSGPHSASISFNGLSFVMRLYSVVIVANCVGSSP